MKGKSDIGLGNHTGDRDWFLKPQKSWCVMALWTVSLKSYGADILTGMINPDAYRRNAASIICAVRSGNGRCFIRPWLVMSCILHAQSGSTLIKKPINYNKFSSLTNKFRPYKMIKLWINAEWCKNLVIMTAAEKITCWKAKKYSLVALAF